MDLSEEHQSFLQAEFHGGDWLQIGLLPIGENLKKRVFGLLPSEILVEQVNFTLLNKRLIRFVNEIFVSGQFYSLYLPYCTSRVPPCLLHVLRKLEESSEGTLENAICIIKRDPSYTEKPPFGKLEMLLAKIHDELDYDDHYYIGTFNNRNGSSGGKKKKKTVGSINKFDNL